MTESAEGVKKATSPDGHPVGDAMAIKRIGDETGLTKKQIDRAVQGLATNGFNG